MAYRGLGVLIIGLLGAGQAFAAPLTADDREAVVRVAAAEARSEPTVGLLAVVDVILNRAKDQGVSVQEVVNARHQFEPVMRAGGTWRNLPQASPYERGRVIGFLDLKEAGVLGDVTDGAKFFQNEDIVRARGGNVGWGMTPSMRVGGHTFYGGGAKRGVAIVETADNELPDVFGSGSD